MLHTKNRIPTAVRQEVYTRDSKTCILCGREGVIHLHHAVPRSQGGKNAADNLVCLCPICHAVTHGEYRLKFDFPFDAETAKDAIHYYLEYTCEPP